MFAKGNIQLHMDNVLLHPRFIFQRWMLLTAIINSAFAGRTTNQLYYLES